MTSFYAIVLKDTNEIVTEDLIKQYCPDYHVTAFRKKVYFTIGTAKNGFASIPDDMQTFVKIQEFTPNGVSLDGVDLQNEYDARQEAKLKREYKAQKLRDAEIARHKEAMSKLNRK